MFVVYSIPPFLATIFRVSACQLLSATLPNTNFSCTKVCTSLVITPAFSPSAMWSIHSGALFPDMRDVHVVPASSSDAAQVFAETADVLAVPTELRPVLCRVGTRK